MMRGKMNIPVNGKTQVNVQGATTSDIINVLHNNLTQATRQVNEVSQYFKASTVKETSRNIFDFLKSNITYIADGINQDIKLPGRFVAEGSGDCKSYSLFTAAVLKSLGIPFKFRYASYTADKTPQHVYIVAGPDDTIIDAVYGHFNKEKPFTYKIDYPMNVRTLSGINGFWDDAWSKTKTGALAAPRGAYLALLSINAFGWATYLNALLKANPQKLKDKWNSLGGNFTDLKNIIAKGAQRQPIFNKNLQVNGIGSIEATIAAATAIIAALGAMVAEGKKLFGRDLSQEPTPPPPPPGGSPADKDSKSAAGGLIAALASAFFLFS